MRLNWQAVNETNQPGVLTFNVRLGTAPGSHDVVAGMALDTGFRLTPGTGNAENRPSLLLTNLPGGALYWSVQAIDPSFAGSPFSTQASFTLPNAPPVASNQSVTLTEDSQRTIVVTGSDPDNDPLLFGVSAPPWFGSVSGTGPTFTYHPNANYFGFDQVTFSASDCAATSALATVFIQVLPNADVPGAALELRVSTNGIGEVTLTAEPWRSYRVEASEDLLRWTPLTNLLCTNLTVQVLAADLEAFPQRFYRAAQDQVIPEFGPAVNAGGNGISWVVRGEAGRAYQVQTSTNLSMWEPLTTLILGNPTGALSTGKNPSTVPQRYYRLVSP